jgi:hypothetical protein
MLLFDKPLASVRVEMAPALIVVTPVYVLAPESVVVPAPAWVIDPVPEITPLYVEASDLLKISALLFVMLLEFDIAPVVLLLPI